MRNYLIIPTLLIGVTFSVSPLRAQTAPKQAAEAQTIPALSGIWEAPYQLARRDICGEPNCSRLLGLAGAPRGTLQEEPQMLPWAEEKYKVSRSPNGNARETANPWFSACTPFSPTALMFHQPIALELRQFPDMVLLLYGGIDDSAVRRVYVDSRGHPPTVQPSWMGHSIGRYDGDTLIVDTVGVKGDRWIDGQGYPHTDALHLVERFRRVDQNKLEYEATIDDPKAYKKPWTEKYDRELASPSPRMWDLTNCEELLQMGTHYGAEAGR